MERICACGCGGIVTSSNLKTKYIDRHQNKNKSQETIEKLRTSNKRGRPRQDITCTRCGVIFSKEFCRITNNNYCSRACFNPRLPLVEINCHYCNKFIVRKTNMIKERNYCSKYCMNKGQPNRGAWMKTEEGRAFASSMRKKEYRSGRQVPKNSTYGKKTWYNGILMRSTYEARCAELLC